MNMKIKLMSSPSLNIFFYSKYVPRCVDLMRQLDLEKIFVFCVDNASIRSKIINDHKWNIRSVPSLLQIYGDGNSKIFTNDDDILKLFLLNEVEQEERQHEEENDIAKEENDNAKEENENDNEKELYEEENDQEIDDDDNNLKQTSTSTVSISNIVQKMQRERENDDHVIKSALKAD